MATSKSSEMEQNSKAEALHSLAASTQKSPLQLDLEAELAEEVAREKKRLEIDDEWLGEWYKALYEEDSLVLMELLEKHSDLGLWRRGWEEESERQVKGRRFNYWTPEAAEPWKGRTSLHVGVRRGNLQLIEKVLKLCEDGGSDEKSLQELLNARDGEYGLDAIAMAVVNGNRDIVTTVLDAASKCQHMRWVYNIKVSSDAHDDGVSLAEDPKLRARLREELRKITREVIRDFENESWFKGSVLRRYELNRDFNFLPWKEYPEFLFHFLFTGLGPAFQQATEIMKTGNLGMSWEESYKLLAGRISVLVLTEIAAKAIASPESPELLVYMWTMQDGQGRPPLHVAVDEEEYGHLMRNKALTLTRLAFSKVDEETLRKTINALDGQGRTAVQRAAAHLDWQESCGKLLDLETGDGYDEFYGDKIGGLYENVAKKYKPDEFHGPLKAAIGMAFRDCLAVGFERKSTWTSRQGRTYNIDLHALNTRYQFTSSKVLWSGGTPLHAAILHGNEKMCCAIGREALKQKKSLSYVDQDITATVDGEFSMLFGPPEAPRQIGERKRFVLDAVGFAAFKGDKAIAKTVLKHHGTYQEKKREENHIPAVCLVAAWGQYTLLQALIDAKHDPSEEDFAGNTVLHHATKGMSVVEAELMPLSVGVLDYVNLQQLLEAKLLSPVSIALTKEHKDQAIADRQGCINLLIQQGCDVFETNNLREAPYPRGDADPDFLKWWHGIQTKEFEMAQAAQSAAANAISVTAALVATASYVGPLQPPLGYSDDDPTQLRLEIMAVKVFIVCDTMSFYMAIAAIIFALVPCLPMPQQPMKDELRRTRKMVNTAVCVLFPSIVCILVAFSAGSISVIQTDKDKWNRGGLTIGTASVGGLLCVIAIAVFTIRVLKIIFHRSKKVQKIYELTSF